MDKKIILFSLGLCLSATSLLHGLEVKYQGNVPAFKNAASELQKYEKLLLNSKTSKAVFTLDIDLKLQEEEWKIRSTGNGVALSGGSARGVTYALYHYLEDVCGVIFMDYNAEYIPELADLPTKNLKLQGKPAFPYRSVSAVHFGKGEFNAKRRINTSGWSRIAAEYGSDNSAGRPAPCHSLATYYLFNNANKKAHPEYFSLVNGKRIGGQFVGQLCLSNPGLREEVQKKLYSYMDADKKDFENGKRYNIPTVYDISQNDNQNYCRCPECKALAKKYGNTQSGVMLDFINPLAEAAAKKAPGTMISTFAYQYTEAIPSNIKAKDNVITVLCDTMGNTAAPLTDATNAQSRKKIEAWSKISKLGFWDYGDQFSDPRNMPVASEFAYADNVKYLLKNNIIDNRLEISSSRYPDAREYKYYLMTNLLENPDADFNKLSEKFANAYYGPAAKLFLRYRKLIHAAGKKRNIFIPMYPSGGGIYSHLDLATVTQSAELFEKGRELLQNDAVLLKRWDLASLALDRAILWRALHLQNEWYRAGRNAADFPLKNLKEIHARAKKVHFQYVNELYKLQNPTKRNQDIHKKLLNSLETEYAKLNGIIAAFDKKNIVPAEFSDIDPARVYFIQPQQFSKAKLVDAPDALSGKAIQFFKQNVKKTAKIKFPLRIEHFDYHIWKGFTSGWLNLTSFPDGEFKWVKFGRVSNVSPSSIFAVNSWALLCSFGDAYQSGGNNNFDGYIRMKITRDADKKVENVLIDSIVLVRDPIMKKAEGNVPAVTVNNIASYAVNQTADGKWEFEYKRNFVNKEKADWLVEFEKNAANYWRIHPKYKYIQGYNRNISLKFDLPADTEKINISGSIGNSADSKTRTFALQISEDGKTYKTVKEEQFFPKPGTINYIYDAKGKSTVWIRFIRKIEKGDNAAYGFGALFKDVCIRFNGKKQ